MKKLKIGLIGCGYMMKNHMNGVRTFDDVEVVAVADPRPERTKDMMEFTGATRSYTSHKELYENEDNLDAVYIAVEPTAHNGIEETAIQRGIPFMVEKPMTIDMAQGKAISDAVTAKGLVTSVGFQDRYLDIVSRTKAELEGMDVGMVYGSWIGGVPQVWWWMQKSTCGGQLLEQNIHLVDLLRYFFGEADSVYATCGRGLVNPSEFPDTLPKYDTDDFSTATFTFKSGVVANLMSGCFVQAGNQFPNGLNIIGRKQSICYTLRNNIVIKTADNQVKIDKANNNQAEHSRAFIDAIHSGDPTAVRSPYPDAFKSLLLADAANRSMESGSVIRL
ncbi:MAG: Gfo/Idh/MocA family oxidoreductase [Oscillospiraceae bacterium]|nr:Gfo/Idh/MocA family oxidoreductase [Oscillospiraceae bacterium]